MRGSDKSSRGGSSSGFKYQERSSEDVRKRAEQQGGQFDNIFKSGVDRWRPADGENVIRILPPTWEDHDHYGYDIWVHSFVGPDKSTYLCPQKMKNEPCPICKAARAAKAAGEDDEAKQLNATRRVAIWIVDRDDEKDTPSLFDMSWSMDRDIATLCHDKRRGKVLLVDHPDEGYDISFTRSGKGLNTRYIGMAVDRDPSPIMSSQEDQDKILEYIQENPIPDILNFYDEAYLDKMINAEVVERDEDLDGDGAAPARGRGGRDRAPARDDRRPAGRGRDDRRASSRRDREPPADEVAEEIVEEEVVDDVADEPPSRTSRRPARDERRPAARDDRRASSRRNPEPEPDDGVAPDDEQIEDGSDDVVDDPPARTDRRPARDDRRSAGRGRDDRRAPSRRDALPPEDYAEFEEEPLDDEAPDDAPPPRRPAGRDRAPARDERRPAGRTESRRR